jgi:ADP-heptose:LPS heptosyltransferase
MRIYSVLYSRRIPIHRKSSGYHQTDLELRHLELFDIKNYIRQPNLCVTDKGLTEADRLFDSKRRPFAVLHPGSGGSAPNWPLEHYRKLAVLIKDFEVVITNHFAGLEGFDGCVDLGGRTDLETLAGVFSRAAIFVSGSTGPLHLADALGVRCVSFFVSRPDIGPERWGPRRNMDNIIVPPDDCICADLRKCRCLECIPPEEALEKITQLLANKKLSGVRRN